MATLTYTRLETHPDGTIGIAGIVGGNWERLEALFNPTLTSADLSFHAFTKAITRNATLPSTNGAVLQWNNTGTAKPGFRAGYAASSTAAPAIDVSGPVLNDITLTGDATFTTSNRAAGWQSKSIVRAGGSLRNLTFPAWVWVGSAAPTTIASGKVALLELHCTDGNDSGIIARWSVQP